MFEGLFKGQSISKTKSKATKLFGGLFSNKKEKISELKQVSEENLNRLTLPTPQKSVFSLPEFLLGGSYIKNITPQSKIEARDISMATKNQIRGGSFQDTLNEVNHIISVALGGTNDLNNLNSLKSDLNFVGKIKRLFGQKIEIDDLKNRQEGRIKIEQSAINDFQSGKISQAEAIVRIKGWDFLQEASRETTQQQGMRRLEGIKAVLPTTYQEVEDAINDPLSLAAIKNPEKFWEDTFGQIEKSSENFNQQIKAWLTPPEKGIKPISQFIAEGLKTTAAGLGWAFSPVSALFAGASNVPIFGVIGKIITAGFSSLGDLKSNITKPIFTAAINKLPIEEKTKKDIIDAEEEITTAVVQIIFGGKLFHKGSEFYKNKTTELVNRFGKQDAEVISKVIENKVEDTKKQIAEKKAKVTIEAKPAIPQELQPLAQSPQEAVAKGISKEEWIKGQVNAFHGTTEKGLKLDTNKPVFLTNDFDSANTYAGYSYNTKPTGRVLSFYAKEGKTLDLNKVENIKKAFQDIKGSPELKKAYNTIPETYNYLDDYGNIRTLNPKSSASDFEDWMMMEYQSKPKIGEGGLKVRTGSYSFEKETQTIRKNLQEAFNTYGKPTRQSVYNNWDSLIKYAKEKGYDYIDHTTESPDASILFPEKVALNPKKTLLTPSQLSSLYDEAAKGVKQPQFKPPAQEPAKIKPEIALIQEAKPTEATKITAKTPEVKMKKLTSQTEFQSRVFERMKAEHPELQGDLTVQRKNMQEDIKKAVDLVAKDKQKAYDIAMGKEKSSDVTSTSVNITLAEKALDEGKYNLYAQLIKNRSLAQTKRGWELVAEKGSVKDNSTSRYVKELISARLDKLGQDYLSRLKRKSIKEVAKDKIDAEVNKLETKIKTKKLDVKTALALLEKLKCLT